jgi:sulfur carrier protein ThiS
MNKINLTVVAIVATLGVLTAAPAAMNNGAILPRAQASTRRIIYINRQLSLQIVETKRAKHIQLIAEIFIKDLIKKYR